MKFVSTGTLVASRSGRDDQSDRQAGFTLLEALVALALVLAFASAVGPHLSQARRIMANAEGRVAAQVLLRSLLDAPFDRSSLAGASREGETNGLRWRIVFEPAAAALGVGHDAACLQQVWTNCACESQNQRQSDERFEQRKSRLPVAAVITVRSRRRQCTS